MGVWITLELVGPRGGRASPRAIVAAALVNTGYEAHHRQIILPESVAARLGLWPLPPRARSRTFGSASGPFTAYEVRGGAAVTVVTRDRREGPVRADAIVSPLERDVLISDALASALRLAILDPKRAIWAFRDELDHPRHGLRRR